MRRARPTWAPAHHRCRTGFAYRGVLFVLPVVIAVPLTWLGFRQFATSEDGGPMTHKVQRGEFIHDITERGNVESASNMEIASKVKSSSGGSTILEIVPEGTEIKPEDCIPEDAMVKLEEIVKLELWLAEEKKRKAWASKNGLAEPGQFESTAGQIEDDSQPADSDQAEAATEEPASEPESSEPESSEPESSEPESSESELEDDVEDVDAGPPVLTFEDLKDKLILVKLNSASLDNDRVERQIIVENSAAAVEKAVNDLETAKIGLQEYEEGKYQQELLGIDIKIRQAKDNLDRLKEFRDFTRQLARKDYVSTEQLQADELAVGKAKDELALAEKDLQVLEEFTKPKMLIQLQSAISTAESKLNAAKKSHKLDLEKLEEIEDQMVNCTIFAKNPGQVVYANSEGYRGHGEVVIEPGTTIRERQVIIRLPDPTQMQVKAKINEAKINLVEPEMAATIRLDAFPDDELSGIVEQVSEYPSASGWGRSDIKEYETIIKIHDPPPGLRPGFTAQVKVRVAQAADKLLVPVQAVFEHGKKHYCVFHKEGKWEAREVTIGPTNDKQVVIEKGIEEGEEVVLNAAAYRDKLDLPELPKEGQRQTPEGSSAGNQPGREPRQGPGGRQTSAANSAGGVKATQAPSPGGQRPANPQPRGNR